MGRGDDHILLRLIDIRKVFSRGTIDEVTALDGINLDVYEQDFVTIIGSNGAGKAPCLTLLPVSIHRSEEARFVFWTRILRISQSISMLHMRAGSIKIPARAQPLN